MENVAFVVILLQMGELFKFKDPHQPFILKSNFSCETSNLLYIYIYIYIYIITSGGCNKKYIG